MGISVAMSETKAICVTVNIYDDTENEVEK
jgi:hypothetical protein